MENIKRKIPTEEELLNVIINSVYINGIGLEDYRHEFEDSGLYLKVLELFGETLPEEVEEEEANIPLTYGFIKELIGWSRFCDVTDHNSWAIAEHGEPDHNETYYITRSQADKLGLKGFNNNE